MTHIEITVKDPKTGKTKKVSGCFLYRGLRADEIDEARQTCGIRCRGDPRSFDVKPVDHVHGSPSQLRNSRFISTTTNYQIAAEGAGVGQRPSEIAVIDVSQVPWRMDVSQSMRNVHNSVYLIGSGFLTSANSPFNPYGNFMRANPGRTSQWYEAMGNAQRDDEVLITQAENCQPIPIIGFAASLPRSCTDVPVHDEL